MHADIYLIRHGRTAGNMRGEYIGVTDQPLCEEGIRELLEYKSSFRYPSVDLCFCKSDAAVYTNHGNSVSEYTHILLFLSAASATSDCLRGRPMMS
jgi:bisphosphoglycerate-dependent phosphoglycerate mutase